MAFPLFRRQGEPPLVGNRPAGHGEQSSVAGGQALGGGQGDRHLGTVHRPRRHFMPHQIGYIVRDNHNNDLQNGNLQTGDPYYRVSREKDDFSQMANAIKDAVAPFDGHNKDEKYDADLEGSLDRAINAAFDAPQAISALPGFAVVYTRLPERDEFDGARLLGLIRQMNETFYDVDPERIAENIEGEAEPTERRGPTLRPIDRIPFPPNDQRFQVLAAIPNWLSCSQQTIGGGTGGPGGLPVPAQAASSGIHLPPSACKNIRDALNITNADVANHINVYVLDTAPDPDCINDKCREFRNPDDRNDLIPQLFGDPDSFFKYGDDHLGWGKQANDWSDKFNIYYDLTPDPDEQNVPQRPLMETLVNEEPVDRYDAKLKAQGGFYLHGSDYDMSDHGLFASSLIAQQYSIFYQDITGSLCKGEEPAMRINLIQVLSNFGVGTMDSFVRGLSKVLDLQAKDPDAPAIVNCSWVLSVPLQIEHLATVVMTGDNYTEVEAQFSQDLEKGEADKDNEDNLLPAGVKGRPLSDYLPYIIGLRALRDTFNRIKMMPGGLELVACAGNDHMPGVEPRPSARYPAAYEEIVGVTSLSSLGKTVRDPAAYANVADDPSNIGFAIWGGEIDIANAVKIGDETIYFTDPNNSPVGLYFDAFFPDALGNKNNDPDADLRRFYFDDQGQTVPPQLKRNDPGIRKNNTGYAHWAGTSFATPIMASALAACLAWRWVPPAVGRHVNFGTTELAVADGQSGKTDKDEMVISTVR